MTTSSTAHPDHYAQLICGIDEAGRGPIAGPVCAAAVILGPEFDRSPLKDSKTLSSAQRDKIAVLILERAVAVGIGWSWPEEIDQINIHHASLLAMQRAFSRLSSSGVSYSRLPSRSSLGTSPDTSSHSVKPDIVLVDGKFTPQLPLPAEAVIKGDAKIPEISAASIIAKVARDRWMVRYSWIESKWAFETHKGYPTAAHRKLCKLHGLSPIHRHSFKIY